MRQLKIDPEFRDKIPPLTAAELAQLEENIVADGEVREPLVVWNDTIIDGHNRWAIIQRHQEIPYKVKQKEFSDKWAAIVWMCQNQMGRRNLTDEQKTYLIGKEYEAQKQTRGGDRGSDRDDTGRFTAKPQSGDLRIEPKKTSQVVADAHSIGRNTVERAERFANGLDAADEISPGFRESILTGTVKVPKMDIAAIAKMDEPERIKAVQAIQSGERVQPIKQKPIEIVEITSSEYNADDLKMELDACTTTFFNNFENSIVFHKHMLSDPECIKKIEAALSEAEAAIKKLKEYIL